jgi:hypothetical protein
MFCDLLLRFWEAVNDGKGGFLRFRRFCFVLHKFASSTRQINLNFWVFVFTFRHVDAAKSEDFLRAMYRFFLLLIQTRIFCSGH